MHIQLFRTNGFHDIKKSTKYRSHAWQDRKVFQAFIPALMALRCSGYCYWTTSSTQPELSSCASSNPACGVSEIIIIIIRFSLNSCIWVATSVEMDDSWDFSLVGLLVGNDILQLLYLLFKAFAAIILKFSNDVSLSSFM